MGNNLSENTLRYIVVALIWVGMLVFGSIMVINGGLEGGLGGLMGAAGFTAAAIATGALFKWGQIEPPVAPREDEQTKRKNDSRGLDPLSLLTEEDIAELREEVKYDLRRRLLQREDGEMNTLDSLLAGQDSQKRR